VGNVEAHAGFVGFTVLYVDMVSGVGQIDQVITLALNSKTLPSKLSSLGFSKQNRYQTATYTFSV
jgi:hypothetical protein